MGHAYKAATVGRFSNRKLSFFLSFERARIARLLMADTESPVNSAVSSQESPSTSRSTKTTRNGVSRSWSAFKRSSLSSVWIYDCSGLSRQSLIWRGAVSDSSISIGSSSETQEEEFRRRSLV